MKARVGIWVAIALAAAACSSGTVEREVESVDAGDGPDGAAVVPGVADAAPDPNDPQEPDAAPEPATCTVPGVAIVADIDETLTTSDLEWITQMLIGTHDPAERPGASDMMQAYADRGFFILYLTARPATTTLGFTGETATDATARWLVEHEFPTDPARTRLILSPDLVLGDATTTYKAGALQDMQAEGFTFAYAYGNATTDIAAYAAAGIPKDVTFIIGAQAGVDNTVAIPGDGWLDHTATHVAAVDPVCEP